MPPGLLILGLGLPIDAAPAAVVVLTEAETRSDKSNSATEPPAPSSVELLLFLEGGLLLLWLPVGVLALLLCLLLLCLLGVLAQLLCLLGVLALLLDLLELAWGGRLWGRGDVGGEV